MRKIQTCESAMDYVYFDYLNADNFSLASREMCLANDDLLRKVLRWVKLIIIRIHQSYATNLFVLVTLPLFVGLSVGYFVGKFQSTDRRKRIPRREQDRLQATRSGKGDELNIANITHREDIARQDLKSQKDTQRESGLPIDQVPKHVAIIMDGNRRYGETKYGSATEGHWDGSRRVLDCAKWCIAEGIQVLTIYAFSTENWKRDPREINALMNIFAKYCEELKKEALERNIRVHVWSTDTSQIPFHVKRGLDSLEEETKHCCGGLQMNICLSYGGRGDIVRACQMLAKDCVEHKMSWSHITEEDFTSALQSSNCRDPDILIRTSGEMRISNFLLWQLAYTEFFFLDKRWPEIDKNDLLEIIRSYARNRNRRYGR